MGFTVIKKTTTHITVNGKTVVNTTNRDVQQNEELDAEVERALSSAMDSIADALTNAAESLRGIKGGK